MDFWKRIARGIRRIAKPIEKPIESLPREIANPVERKIIDPAEKLPREIAKPVEQKIIHPAESLPGEIANKIINSSERLANQAIDKLKTIAISSAGDAKVMAIHDAMVTAKISGKALDGIEAGSRLAISYAEKGAKEVELYGELAVKWLDQKACEVGMSVALGTVFAAMFDAPDPETVAEDTALTAPLTAAAAEFLAQGKEVALRAACDATANAFVDLIWIAPAVRQGIGSENKEMLTLSISCTLENTMEIAAATFMVPEAAASVVAGIVTAATSDLACDHTVPKGTREPTRTP